LLQFLLKHGRGPPMIMALHTITLSPEQRSPGCVFGDLRQTLPEPAPNKASRRAAPKARPAPASFLEAESAQENQGRTVQHQYNR